MNLVRYGSTRSVPRTTERHRTTALDEARWYRKLGDVVAAIGEPGFAPTLVEALGQIASFDHSVIFAYRGSDRPLCLYDTFNKAQRHIYVTLYQEGPYLLDPFYHACRDRVAPGLYRMRQLAPDRFYQSEYFRSYYVKTRLAEEIAFFFPLRGEIMVALSLMRADTGPVFSGRAMARLSAIEPVVRSICRRHWQDVVEARAADSRDGPTPPAFDTVMARVFQQLGPSSLTRRECEVVSLVLQGHSSESIGRLLGITPGTAKIHRKNIYRKLGISSQAEMFSLFLAILPQDAQSVLARR